MSTDFSLVGANPETVCARPAQRRDSSAKSVTTFCDHALVDLSPEARERFRQSETGNLFESLGFSESYCTPAADRVCYFTNESGYIAERCFYKETRWAGLVKINVAGPVNLGGELLMRLRRLRGATIVSASFFTAEDLPMLEPQHPRPCIRQMAADSCINLPRTTAEYLLSLGGNTRKHLPYYLRRIQREWAKDWSFAHYAGVRIPKALYASLLELNDLRMNQRGSQSLWTVAVAERRWKLVEECGLFCGVFLRGQLVSGTLSFMKNEDAYLIVIGHNPQFDRLNLGNVTLWLTIEELIARGLSRYHLLWGRSFYKRQFGARPYSYYKVTCFSGTGVAVAWRISDLLFSQTQQIATRLGARVRRNHS